MLYPIPGKNQPPRPSIRRYATKYFSLLLLITAIHIQSYAQCTSTGFHDGTVFATQNPGGLLDFNFDDAAKVGASDDSRSVASSLLGLLIGETHYLRVTGFNFSIPPLSTICGIRVSIERQASGLGVLGSIRDNAVRILRGGVMTGDNKASASNWPSSGDAIRIYGSTTDTWNITGLTREEVNAPDFGIAISVHLNGIIVIPSAEIDNIRIAVEYNSILPVTISQFNAVKNKSGVQLDWKTTEEEDRATIELQRSSDGTDWKTLSSYALHSLNINKAYSYKDLPSQHGNYSYRLKTTTGTGAVVYSDTRHVAWNEKNTWAVYPNPARDFIYINTPSVEDLFVTTASLQPVRLQAEKTGAEQYRLNIQALPRGIYFARVGNQVTRFMKD